MGKKSKRQKIKDISSRYRDELIAGGLVGATIGMQAFGAHYMVPGYGIPIDSEGVSEFFRGIGTGLSRYTYGVSATISDATIGYDPSAPFFYMDIFKSRPFSIAFNSVHHALGGVAVGYLMKRYVIDPMRKAVDKIKDSVREKSVEVEEAFKDYDKVLNRAYKWAFWGGVATVSVLWEAYEMNFFSDRMLKLPAVLAEPETYDGLKDIALDMAGAGTVYYNKRIRKAASKYFPTVADVKSDDHYETK